MKTRRLVRRSLLTAAVSTASLFATLDSRAVGFEITASPASSGIQRVQYQPGQQGQPAQANPAVTAELKKMFEESGQPMPSMNPRDLPNAQGQTNNVRPIYGRHHRPEQESCRCRSSSTGSSRLCGTATGSSVRWIQRRSGSETTGRTRAASGHAESSNRRSDDSEQQAKCVSEWYAEPPCKSESTNARSRRSSCGRKSVAGPELPPPE